MGASDTGWECCRALLDIDQNVVGILSVPREFSISWSNRAVTNVRFKSFDDLARAYRIPLVYVTQSLSATRYMSVLDELKPDLLVVIGWYHVLPKRMLALPRLGAVGIHSSLLPKYRGGAPLVWAMIQGEKKTGVTLFHLTNETDAGDVIAQVSFPIARTDQISDIIGKATRAAVSLVSRHIPAAGAGHAPRTPQDHRHATVMPQRCPDDGVINWSALSAEGAYNWVRAQSRPYPGAFTWLEGRKLTIWRATMGTTRTHAGVPGELVVKRAKRRDGFGVRCADARLLWVHDLQIEGGQPTTAASFLSERSSHLEGVVLGRS